MPKPPPSLADEFAAHIGPQKGPRCSVATVTEMLDGADQTAFVAAVGNPAMFATSIAAVLRKRGVRIGADAIQRHRRRVCSCEAIR